MVTIEIIEEKGGTISVDSDVGRGAAFVFTWPKRDPLAAIKDDAAQRWTDAAEVRG